MTRLTGLSRNVRKILDTTGLYATLHQVIEKISGHPAVLAAALPQAQNVLGTAGIDP